MLADVTDTALIAELRTTLVRAGEDLDAWHRRAMAAVELAERNDKALTETVLDRDAHAARAVELAARVAELEVLVEVLRCGDLAAFADGELAPDRAVAFREHLGRCVECQSGLERDMQIDALLTAAAVPRPPRST